MNDNLENFLEKSAKRVSRKCMCCKNEKLAADIARYLDLLVAGETDVPLRYLHAEYLRPKYSKPLHWTSIKDHIVNCLRRDPATGTPISGDK